MYIHTYLRTRVYAQGQGAHARALLARIPPDGAGVADGGVRWLGPRLECEGGRLSFLGLGFGFRSLSVRVRGMVSDEARERCTVRSGEREID